MESTVAEITYSVEFKETIGKTVLEIRKYTGPYLPKPIFCAYRYHPLEKESLEQVPTVNAGQKQLRKWRVAALVTQRAAAAEGK